MAVVCGDDVSCCRKAVRDLADEELRLGIGQEMSLAFLVPTAIGRLDANPLASGGMYEGALLRNVMLVAAKGGLSERDLQRFDNIVERFRVLASEKDAAWRDECFGGIVEAVALYSTFRCGT